MSIFGGSSSGPTMLRKRISSRPIPRSRARGPGGAADPGLDRHGPRDATYVALFDATIVVVKPSAGSRYGPGSIVRIIIGYMAALNGNAGDAPWSIVMCTRSSRSVPSGSPRLRRRGSLKRLSGERRCSLRSSIHLTDRPSSTAAASTATSSRVGSTFTPNAPPTSCAVTRGKAPGLGQESQHGAGQVREADRFVEERQRHRPARRGGRRGGPRRSAPRSRVRRGGRRRPPTCSRLPSPSPAAAARPSARSGGRSRRAIATPGGDRSARPATTSGGGCSAWLSGTARCPRPGRPRRRTRAVSSAGSSSGAARTARGRRGWRYERPVDVAVVALIALQHVAVRRGPDRGQVGSSVCSIVAIGASSS